MKDVDAQGTPSFVPPDEGIPPEQVIGSQGKDSDGDLEMLQWATAGPGRRFALIVHHTDAEREWAYERTPGFGELDKALREARTKGWIVVDMKRDWTKVYAFE